MGASARALALTIVAAAACGHKAGDRERVVATISDTDYPHATPVWLGAAGGTLFVGISGSGDTWGLLRIDPSTGAITRIAHDLPAGAFAPTTGAVYLVDYVGKLGAIDPATGAYRPMVDLGENAQSIAVVPSGVLVGAASGVLLLDPHGGRRAIAPSQPGGPPDRIDSLVVTSAGVLATSRAAGTILRIDGEHATVIADHQDNPQSVTATSSHIAWITDDAGGVGHHVVAMPLAGGAPVSLVDLAGKDLAHSLAARGDDLVYGLSSATPGVFTIPSAGGAPHRVSAANATQIAAMGGTIYWIAAADRGWSVFAAP